jgi:gluconate 2-dehydrogenase alpha chain
MGRSAIVVGSGAGGSVSAMVLAEAGWDVTILEKGPNRFGDLRSPTPLTRYSNDELKGDRGFEGPDPDAEPRTYRRHPEDSEPLAVGEVNSLPSTVGGGTVHWDAKTPRFWDIDFKKLSLMGPVAGADVRDWPFTYAQLSPFYDEIERLIGVAGDVDQLPATPTLTHAPRTRKLPMPPGPPQHGSLLAAEGARLTGLTPYAVPMAINSRPYAGRPACNNCGFCSGYGCPIQARVGALAPLRRALLAGAHVVPESFAIRVEHSGRRATGVTFLDRSGRRRTLRADAVVLAGSAIETIRLALLSRLPDPSKQIGRHLMFHWFTQALGVFLTERIHAHRGRSTTHAVDDFADPDFPGAAQAAAASGLPYLRGGVLELGGSQGPLGEAFTYKDLLPVLSPGRPFGTRFKQLMRASLLRDRLLGIEMIGEDLAQPTNAVDLDPSVKDLHGVPVPRVTYAPHAHEIAAQRFYSPRITALLLAAGASAAAAVPATSSDEFPIGGSGDVPAGRHIMGGMRMGSDPRASVVDGHGRFHRLDNLFVTDGSVFATSGAHNPTLTIMATALRSARHQFGG